MFGISKHGFKRKTYDDILQELFKKSRETFGENINLTSKSLYGMFLRVLAWVLSKLWQLAEKVYLSSFVKYAEGVNLDRIASNIGLTRLGKQYAEGYINVYVDELPLELDTGFIVEGLNQQRYRTIEPVIIRENGQEVFVRSVEKGLIANAEAHTVDTIITPVAEVDYITNESAIVGGKDEETDDEFRKRYYKSLSAAGSSTRASIEASLRQLAGVVDVVVKENDTKEYIDGLPPHFIHCLVLGGKEQDIGKTILSTKAAGIGTFGDEKVTVIDPTGLEHIAFYDKAGVDKIDVTIRLTVDGDYSKSYEKTVQELVDNYLSTLNIGETVYSSRVTMELRDVPGITNSVVTFKDGLSEYTPDKKDAIRLKDLVVKYD